MDRRVHAPEADAIEQDTPAGPEPEPPEVPAPDTRLGRVPEADALEQALPADREVLEDDE